MSDIRLTHALNANAQHESEHASLDGSAATDGALHATEDGAAYDGSAGGDVSYAADEASGSAGADASVSASGEGVDVAPDVDGLPETPELPVETPDLPADVPTLPGDLSTDAVPELPELPEPTGSADVAATFQGMLDAMGDVMAEWAASVGAMLGF